MGRFWDSVTLGPRRRRRAMRRRLAQLDALDDSQSVQQLWRAGSSGPVQPGASTGRLVGVLAVILLLVVAVVVGLRSLARGASSSAETLSSSQAPRPAGTIPPAGVGEAAQRLLPPVPAPGGTGGYEVTRQDPAGGPVRYDPCRPIHYVTRDRNTPAGGDQRVREAIAAVSAASGLPFVDDGSTGEAPTPSRVPYQPARYGDRWAPVLIAWSDPADDPELAGPTIGTGGSNAVTIRRGSDPSTTGYVTGSLTLDGPQLAGVQRDNGPAAVRAVIEHELGHLVGLNHVTDPGQLMYPEAQLHVTQYGTGDRRGLALLGSGPCLPQI